MVSTEEEKVEHGRRLREAMVRKGVDIAALADFMEKSTRTIGNWRNGHNMPDAADLAKLYRLLGPYYAEGDPVEVAVRHSELTEDRQYAVIGFYKRQLREQGLDQAV